MRRMRVVRCRVRGTQKHVGAQNVGWTSMTCRLGLLGRLDLPCTLLPPNKPFPYHPPHLEKREHCRVGDDDGIGIVGADVVAGRGRRRPCEFV